MHRLFQRFRFKTSEEQWIDLRKIGMKVRNKILVYRFAWSTLFSFALDVLFASFFLSPKGRSHKTAYKLCRPKTTTNKQTDKQIRRQSFIVGLLFGSVFIFICFISFLPNHILFDCVFICVILHRGIMRMAKAPCLLSSSFFK